MYSEGKKNDKEETSVLTVRISKELDQILDKIKERKGISKATIIRYYLEMAKYILIDIGAIRSLDEREMIMIKKKKFKKYLKSFEEEEQMREGVKFARFINDLARVQGKLDDIHYKLDLCEHLGFFPKFIDEENYILFTNKFGPKKFVEAFAYKLIHHDPEMEYDFSFTEEALESSKKMGAYQKFIQPVARAATYYAFEYAKIPEVEEED
jgi:predicted DNA-binding protein